MKIQKKLLNKIIRNEAGWTKNTLLKSCLFIFHK
jgi:hypothetical protein